MTHPVGMYLSVEQGAKESWHPVGMPLSDVERRIPTGCEKGGDSFSTERCIPLGCMNVSMWLLNTIGRKFNPVRGDMLVENVIEENTIP